MPRFRPLITPSAWAIFDDLVSKRAGTRKGISWPRDLFSAGCPRLRMYRWRFTTLHRGQPSKNIALGAINTVV